MADRHLARRGLIGRGKIRLPLATTTQLADVGHRVNTGRDKVEGSVYFNITTNMPVYSVGSADDSVWVDATASTAHTPV